MADVRDDNRLHEGANGREPGDFTGTVENDPYAILGVGRRASPYEIRAAYLTLAKELHPDGRPPDPGAHDADERLKLINDAYQELKGFGAQASARKARQRKNARRMRAVFLAGVLTSSSPILVVLVAGYQYPGWLGSLRSSSTPEAPRAPGSVTPTSEHSRDPSVGREAAWTEAQKKGTREAWEQFIATYPDGEHALQAKTALAAIERAEVRRREETTAWAAAEKSGAKE